MSHTHLAKVMQEEMPMAWSFEFAQRLCFVRSCRISIAMMRDEVVELRRKKDLGMLDKINRLLHRCSYSNLTNEC